MLKKLLTILIVCLASLTLVGSTYAGPVSQYFKDTETSTGNSFSATTLDFSLRDTSDTLLTPPLFNDTGIVPGYSSSKTIRIKKDGLADFKYNISAIKTGGDAVLCNALQVDANIGGGAAEYSGSLTGLTLLPVAAISGSEDDWEMTVKLTDSSADLQSKSCQFNFVVSGWQTDSNGTWGLTDQEEIGNSITSGDWLPAPHQVTVHLFPIADTELDEQNPEDNYGDTASLKVRSKSTNKDSHALFRFDLSVLPPLATIDSCNLKAYMNDAPAISRTHDVHLVTNHVSDWGEGSRNGGAAHDGESSWTWYAKPNFWSAAGGDYNPTATNTIPTGTTTGWKTWDVKSDCLSRIVYSWIIKDSSEESPTKYETEYKTKEQSGTDKDPYLEVTFTAPAVSTNHVVINEVYYDVGTGKGTDSGGNEWVELYNPTSSAINISGWKICDASSCDTIPSSPSIPAYGFAIITNDASTWTHWAIDPGAIQIVLGSEIGSGLNNDGDQVILKNASDAEQDKMSYGNDTSFFTLPDVDEGWSLARLIKGFDTNSASDFWANNNPNPGTNPNWTPMLFVDSEEHPAPDEKPEATQSGVITLDVASANEKKEVGFRIYGDDLPTFDSYAYTVSYDSEQGQQGIMGEKKIEGKNDIEVNHLLLGTCSSGGTCTYHSGVSKVTFEVELKGEDTITLQKELSL